MNVVQKLGLVRSKRGDFAVCRRIEFALNIMRERYNYPLCLTDVAREVSLSPSRFRHLFRQHSGATFRAKLRELRLDAAAKLLEHSSCSVKEIAAQVGYSHTPNFTRDFKPHFGCNPSDYRKKVWQPLLLTNSPL